MPKHIDLNRGDAFHPAIMDALMEFLSAIAGPSVSMMQPTYPIWRGAHGTSGPSVPERIARWPVCVNGLWRWRDSNADAYGLDGGNTVNTLAGGVFDVFLIASANEFGNANEDPTDYWWYFDVRAVGNTPTGTTPNQGTPAHGSRPIVASRRIGRIYFDNVSSGLGPNPVAISIETEGTEIETLFHTWKTQQVLFNTRLGNVSTDWFQAEPSAAGSDVTLGAGDIVWIDPGDTLGPRGRQYRARMITDGNAASNNAGSPTLDLRPVTIGGGTGQPTYGIGTSLGTFSMSTPSSSVRVRHYILPISTAGYYAFRITGGATTTLGWRGTARLEIQSRPFSLYQFGV